MQASRAGTDVAARGTVRVEGKGANAHDNAHDNEEAKRKLEGRHQPLHGVSVISHDKL